MKRPTSTKRRAYKAINYDLRSLARTKQKALLSLTISKPTLAHTTSATRSTASRKTKATASKAGPTSGLQVANRARTIATQHSGASTAHSEKIGRQNRVQAALEAQAGHSSIDNQSLQRTGEIYRAISPFTVGQLEASNASYQKAFTVGSGPAAFSTAYLPVLAGACRTTTDLGLLWWNLTPFTLEPVGDHFYCPRVIVDPGTALSRILSPASYPLDSAVTLIHEQANSGKSLPCEAVRVLTVYDELHRLDFSGTRVTLLDPKLFDSLDYSPMEKNAFHRKVGGWIDLLGHEIGLPSKETWHLNSIKVDYTHFGIGLWLSKGSHQMVYALSSHGADPPRRQKPLQRYQNSSNPPTAQQMQLDPDMFETIVFCHYLMKEECNSEDICMVLMRRNNGYQLEPHDIDLLGCRIFQERFSDGGSDLIRWLEWLNKEEKQQLKDKFWEDLALAQEASFCWRPWV